MFSFPHHSDLAEDARRWRMHLCASQTTVRIKFLPVCMRLIECILLNHLDNVLLSQLLELCSTPIFHIFWDLSQSKLRYFRLELWVVILCKARSWEVWQAWGFTYPIDLEVPWPQCAAWAKIPKSRWLSGILWPNKNSLTKNDLCLCWSITSEESFSSLTFEKGSLCAITLKREYMAFAFSRTSAFVLKVHAVETCFAVFFGAREDGEWMYEALAVVFGLYFVTGIDLWAWENACNCQVYSRIIGDHAFFVLRRDVHIPNFFPYQCV